MLVRIGGSRDRPPRASYKYIQSAFPAYHTRRGLKLGPNWHGVGGILVCYYEYQWDCDVVEIPKFVFL